MLSFSIDGKGKMPIYEQIYRHIREEIKNGMLPCGIRLPSGRKLAENLQVSRNTVELAYEQLVSEGYIEAIPKRGYFVLKIDSLYFQKKGEFQVEKKTETPNVVQEQEQERYLVDFSPQGVDLEFFPYNKWRKILRDLLIDDNKELFLAGEPQGDFELRKAVRQYLHESRGVNCREEQIVIGAGNDYLLLLLTKILGDGRVVAVENPVYKQAYTVFQNSGYPVASIPVDDQGIRVDELSATEADLVYVTPSHQFPLGNVMSANRKAQLLAWAAGSREHYILEDDYDSEFRYLGRPIPALQSRDPFEKVIYMGTLSKAIAPGIRLSYLVLPATLLERYRINAGFYFSTVSRIDQHVISQFILQGHFERHLNRMRTVYKAKHDLLLQCLKETGGRFRIRGERAGLHLLLEFGKPTPLAARMERKWVEEAKKEGIRIYPLADYYIIEEIRKPTILLGFARLNYEQIEEGIKRLSKICEQWDVGQES